MRSRSNRGVCGWSRRGDWNFLARRAVGTRLAVSGFNSEVRAIWRHEGSNDISIRFGDLEGLAGLDEVDRNLHGVGEEA
jgi:hypothetical protein